MERILAAKAIPRAAKKHYNCSDSFQMSKTASIIFEEEEGSHCDSETCKG